MGYNVGGVDRVLRIVASLALVILATTSRSAAGAAIGVVPLATGLPGRCPAYALFGIKTCKSAKV